eukprot:TRINITY_DN10692_c0_g1_i2.p1 TRINITY_DN10692_c0_g1~~TRINITY_DN10692_c0_g1_i2.p1  ORF type:complete len:320 (+),score=36.20 TRINITY_DN10692_c0_g1_i2:376-1335(+)
MSALSYDQIHAGFDMQDAFNSLVFSFWRRVPVLNDKMNSVNGDVELKAMPEASTSWAIFFVLALGILAVIWITMHVVFNRFWSTFSNVRPRHKQWYIIANFSKAIILGGQCCSFAWWYYSYLHHACAFNPLLRQVGFGQFQPCAYDAVPLQESFTKTVCATYVITDALALFMVPKLPTSTIIHHVSTTLFLALMLTVRLSDHPVGQKLVMYGFWSTIAFPVNAFLALRVLYPTARRLKHFAQFSAMVYSICCFFNWLLHLAWLVDGLFISQDWTLTATIINTAYLAFVGALVNDDLVLLKWLLTFDPEKGRAKSAQKTR